MRFACTFPGAAGRVRRTPAGPGSAQQRLPLRTGSTTKSDYSHWL